MALSEAQTGRAAGVLLAQACGDALGVPWEFATPLGPGEWAQMLGGGLGDYAPGEWSDDTQMSIGIAQVSATGRDLTSTEVLDDIAEYFLRWRREGATDIGVQTASVLHAAQSRSGRPSIRLREAAQDYADHHERAAGNGAPMRTAIIGLSAVDDREATAAAARAVAELTHSDPLAGDSCVLWCEAIRLAVLHQVFDLAAGLDLIPAPRRAHWRAWINDAETLPPETFTPNGFCVVTLQAAWSAIIQTDPSNQTSGRAHDCSHLQDALHAAVRIGNDTDTVAAIAGGLLGAFWGLSAVPLAWTRQVHGWPGLRARDLVRLAHLTVQSGRPDREGWPTCETLDYRQPPQPAVPHPADPGVLLGNANASDHHAAAVVSLCRLGVAEVPAPGVRPENHIEVRLIDSDVPEVNPNLPFVLRETAETIRTLRQERHTVLVHCVRAEQRTPSVALAYSRLLGVTADEAMQQIADALPDSRRRGHLWETAARVQ
jgi:ADP-ribosyl-[dinitrogen reductase] hydrolase